MDVQQPRDPLLVPSHAEGNDYGYGKVLRLENLLTHREQNSVGGKGPPLLQLIIRGPQLRHLGWWVFHKGIVLPKRL